MAAGSVTIRELLVRMGIDADEDALNRWDGAIEGAKANMAALATAVVAATAVVVAAGAAFVAQAVHTAEFSEQVAESSAALGLTTDKYQELLFTAQRFGIEGEKLAQLFGKLAVKQQEAAEGGDEVKELFKGLGLSLDEVKNADPVELLNKIADSFASSTDPAKRLATAVKLFGDDLARKMVPLLSLGADGLAGMAAEARRLGLVLDREAIERADAFNNQLELLGAIVGGLRNELGIALIPALSKIIERFLTWYEANRDIVELKIDEYAQDIADAFTEVSDAIVAVNDAIGGAEGWAKLAEAIGGLTGATGVAYLAARMLLLAGSIVTATQALAALVGGGTALVLILGLVAAGIANVVIVAAGMAASLLVVQDFIAYLNGQDSVFGRLIERWKEAPGILGAMSRLMEAFGRVGEQVLGRLEGLWTALADAIAPVLDLMGVNFEVDIDKMIAGLNALTPIVDAAADALNRFASFLGAGGPQQQLGGVVGALPGSSVQTGLPERTTDALSRAASFAPTAGTGRPAAATNQTIGGDTITINGIGITAKEAEDLILRKLAEKSRLAMATFEGAEV